MVPAVTLQNYCEDASIWYNGFPCVITSWSVEVLTSHFIDRNPEKGIFKGFIEGYLESILCETVQVTET